MIGSTLVASAMAAVMTAASSISGVYVGATGDTVQLVQIVRTPDGRLAGRLEEVGLVADGSIKDETIALDGAADGGQITLAPKSILISGNAASLSGFIDGDLLDLSWQGGHLTLKRADSYAFEAAVTGLKTRSSMIIADRDAKAQAADRAARTRYLLQSAQTLNEEVSSLQRDLPQIQQRLEQTRADYARLQIDGSHFRHRQAALAETVGFAVPAMRAGVDAQGRDVDLQGVHIGAAAFRNEVEIRMAAARRDLSKVQLACRGFATASDANVEASCRDADTQGDSLAKVSGDVESSFDATEASFQHPARYVPIGRRLLSGLMP